MRIVKNYLYNAGYQIFLLMVPLITTPYIARVLGPHGVGINSFTNSIIQYFVLFGSIGINLYGNREIAYHRDDKRQMSRIFWEIEILRIVAIIAASGAFLVFMLFEQKYHVYLLMQSLLIIAAAFDISWFFMGIEDFKTTVLRNTLVKLLSIILIFLLVKSTSDIAIYILIISSSQLLGNFTLWPYLRKRLLKISFRDLNVWRHFRPTLVLFIPQIATQIYLVLNKTMLGSLSGVVAAGLFDNSDKIIKMVLAVVTATGTVMLPRVANVFVQGNIKKVNLYLYNTFDFVTFSSIPLLFGLAAIAPKFSLWFFGAKFTGINRIIMIEAPAILMIAWNSAIGNQYLLPTNRNKAFTVSVTIGAIVNLIVNIPLITYFGAIGAAFSTVISEASVTGYQIYIIRKQIKIPKLLADVWKYLCAGILMFVIVYMMNTNLPFNIIMLIIEVLVGIFVYGLGIFLLRPKILKQLKLFLKNK